MTRTIRARIHARERERETFERISSNLKTHPVSRACLTNCFELSREDAVVRVDECDVALAARKLGRVTGKKKRFTIDPRNIASVPRQWHVRTYFHSPLESSGFRSLTRPMPSRTIGLRGDRPKQKHLTSLDEHSVILHGCCGDTSVSQRPISTSVSDAARSWQPTGGHLFFLLPAPPFCHYSERKLTLS